MTRYSLLYVTVLLLSLPACGTEEVSTNAATVDSEVAPDEGGLLIIFAPTSDTFEEAQARGQSSDAPMYGVIVDGHQLVFDEGGGSRVPVLVGEGGEYGAGYFAGGLHHVEIASPGGHRIFAGDGDIPRGSVTRLYLFGHLDALAGRFLSYPEVPATGTQHVSVVNLIRLGPGLEVVSCESTTDCVPLSPTLGTGENFDADFPAVPPTESGLSLSRSGAGIGYRQFPTDRLPAPPVMPLYPAVRVSGADAVPPANFLAAPVYLSPEGNALALVN